MARQLLVKCKGDESVFEFALMCDKLANAALQARRGHGRLLLVRTLSEEGQPCAAIERTSESPALTRDMIAALAHAGKGELFAHSYFEPHTLWVFTEAYNTSSGESVRLRGDIKRSILLQRLRADGEPVIHGDASPLPGSGDQLLKYVDPVA